MLSVPGRVEGTLCYPYLRTGGLVAIVKVIRLGLRELLGVLAVPSHLLSKFCRGLVYSGGVVRRQ